MTMAPPLQQRPTNSNDVERVDNLLDTVGELTTPLTGQQRAALWLAAGVFGLVLSITAITLILLWSQLPAALPPLPKTDAELATYRALVEQHNLLADAVYERARNIFQTFVASALLPVFTGIIGYIFGRERGA